MPIDFAARRTTLDELGALRDNIEQLHHMLGDDDAADLRLAAQQSLTLLEDVLGNLLRRFETSKTLQITPAELRVVAASVQTATALNYFVSRPARDSVLQYLH